MTRRLGSERRVPLTPAFLVAAARGFVGVDLTHVLPPGVRSDIAFVNHVGYWSHFGDALGRSRWPLPDAGGAEELAQWAGISGLLAREPLEGDVYLIWDEGLGRFERTGIVAAVIRRKEPYGDAPADLCEVIEGGSTQDPLSYSIHVDRHERFFLPRDRFVRWAGPMEDEAEVALTLLTERLIDLDERQNLAEAA